VLVVNIGKVSFTYITGTSVGLITASDHIRGHRTASEFRRTASNHSCDQHTQKRLWKESMITPV